MSRNFVSAPQTGTADSRTGTLHTHARHTRPHLYHLQLRTPVPSSSTSLRAGASLPNNPPDTTSASPSLISTSILHPWRSSAHSPAQPSSFILLPPPPSSPLLPHTFMSASRSPDAHGCLSADADDIRSFVRGSTTTFGFGRPRGGGGAEVGISATISPSRGGGGGGGDPRWALMLLELRCGRSTEERREGTGNRERPPRRLCASDSRRCSVGACLTGGESDPTPAVGSSE